MLTLAALLFSWIVVSGFDDRNQAAYCKKIEYTNTASDLEIEQCKKHYVYIEVKK